VELFFNAILTSVNKLIRNGCLPAFEYAKGMIEVFKNVLSGNMRKFFTSLIYLNVLKEE
jgi:hypothetical protein